MLDRPAIGPFLRSFQWRDSKPKNRTTHRVLAGNNFAVVLANRLTGPANSFRFFRQIHIHQGHLLFCEEQFDDLADVRLELCEVWLTAVAHWCADGDAAQSEQRGLFRSGQSAGMPTGVAKIQTQIDPGEHKIDVSPAVRAECDAIGRCAIHAISLEVSQSNPFVAQRPRGSDGVTHGGLLDIRRDDAHLAKARCNLRQRRNAGTIDTVVVRNQDSSLHINKKRASEWFWPNSLQEEFLPIEHASHIDAQSEGRRCRARRKAIDDGAGLGRTSRHLSIDQEERLQNSFEKTHRPRSRCWRRRYGRKNWPPTDRQRHSAGCSPAWYGQ